MVRDELLVLRLVVKHMIVSIVGGRENGLLPSNVLLARTSTCGNLSDKVPLLIL